MATQIQRWITDYGLFPSLTHLFDHPLAHTKLEKPPIRFRNCAQSRKYFLKALLSPTASDILKSTIHSLIIVWHMNASDTKLRMRHLYAAQCNACVASCVVVIENDT